jgi:hypothetical protein
MIDVARVDSVVAGAAVEDVLGVAAADRIVALEAEQALPYDALTAISPAPAPARARRPL